MEEDQLYLYVDKPVPYSTVQNISKVPSNHDYRIKLYKRRYFILLVFCLGTFCNAFSFVQYSIVTDVMSRYYNVSNIAINLTGIVYSVGFCIAMIPAIIIYEKKGLKFGMIIGLAGNALGSCLKCAGMGPGSFWIALAGQSILALAQACFLTITPYIASSWFGSDEVSTAGAAGILSNCLAIAICSVVSPFLIYGNDVGVIYKNFGRMLYSQAGVASLVLIAAFWVVRDKPEQPPSLSQARLKETSNLPEPTVIQNMLAMIRNRNMIFLSISFSINYAVLCTLSTLLNQIILNVYGAGANQQVGFVLLSLQASNVVGAISAGILLDKTKRYKLIAYTMYIISFLCVAIFSGVIYIRIEVVYVMCSLIGFFVGGFLTVGLDLCTEMSYPVSEVSALGLSGMIGNVISLVYMLSCGIVIEAYGELVTNCILVGGYAVGFILLAKSKIELKRLIANESSTEVHNQ